MELGMIGLGRMGANMAERLAQGGHSVVAFDPDTRARARALQAGIAAADSLEALVKSLKPPRALWMMIPAGEITERTVVSLLPLLAKDDVLIDGGNSRYEDSIRRAALAADRQIAYVDCGTSGGIWGVTEGYSLMIGGDAMTVDRLAPIFATLAPAPGQGWGRVGPAGSGHFVKMIHNGIEYGLMQSYAEGFAILRHKHDFGLDLQQIAEIWRHGSVVRSWLLDLTAQALKQNPGMEGIAPVVADSGEGRWTLEAAMALNVPAPVIALSLISRLRSRDAESFSDRLIAAMRQQFGGHPVTKT